MILMRRMLFASIFFLAIFQVNAQQKNYSFFEADSLKKDVAFLASDALKGRANLSKELEIASQYIASNFRALGLKDFEGLAGYMHSFFLTQPEKGETWEEVLINKKKLKATDYFFTTAYENPPSLHLNKFVVHKLSPSSAKELADSIAVSISLHEEPQLYIVPAANKSMIASLKLIKFDYPKHSLLVVANNDSIVKLLVQMKQKFMASKLMNIVGVLPGKSRPEEMVLITAHYDHIGVSGIIKSKDSIYNGANDDACGVAAMMAMAKYFANRQDNERTIVFVAFAGEELGLYGSANFANYISPKTIAACFNLEMLGIVHGKGKKKLMMTGAEYGNLHGIMKKYCDSIIILADNYTAENMFMRSDNYSFASKGVPAHTFMCFTPNDKNYHQVTDEIKTLDFGNMGFLVKGLLPAIEAVVQRKETPKRLDVKQLK
jgi:hypothetical protein